MKRVHPSKRAFVRRFPEPPETPEGMVYALRDGKTVLVPAKEVSAAAARRMNDFDNLDPEQRTLDRNVPPLPQA